MYSDKSRSKSRHRLAENSYREAFKNNELIMNKSIEEEPSQKSDTSSEPKEYKDWVEQ